jgi:hypothetical protein
VRGIRHVVKTRKTPMLRCKEWQRLIDAIPADTVRELCDRALILTYGFARHRGGIEDAGRGPAIEGHGLPDPAA